MAAVLLKVESSPGDRNTRVLTMTDEGLDVSGVSFAWPEIDRVRYGAVDSYVNGGYVGTTYRIEVGNAARKKTRFKLTSRTTGVLKNKIDHERRERNRAEWIKAVEILEERVCGRLAAEAVMTVRGGGTAECAGVRLDPQGVRRSGPFGRSVAWQDIAGTEVKHPYVRIFARRGEQPKKAIKVPIGTWNAVLLPRVIEALSQR
ncbi:hypothetical protein ACRYCC_04840 [Actinomadura scrupuli]|uniref:hypothetical protein n=1 Tax=Actinomadura scrupuli TaxID=559629 RepID=UPI003D9936E7